MDITSLEFLNVVSEDIKVSGKRRSSMNNTGTLFFPQATFFGSPASEASEGFASNSESDQASGLDVSSEASSQAVATPPEE